MPRGRFNSTWLRGHEWAKPVASGSEHSYEQRSRILETWVREIKAVRD